MEGPSFNMYIAFSTTTNPNAAVKAYVRPSIGDRKSDRLYAPTQTASNLKNSSAGAIIRKLVVNDSSIVGLFMVASRNCSNKAVGMVKVAAHTKTRNILSKDCVSSRFAMKKWDSHRIPGATPSRTYKNSIGTVLV